MFKYMLPSHFLNTFYLGYLCHCKGPESPGLSERLQKTTEIAFATGNVLFMQQEGTPIYKRRG